MQALTFENGRYTCARGEVYDLGLRSVLIVDETAATNRSECYRPHDCIKT